MLIGLIGVGIPILIHLFARQKLQKIEFSSNRFLKRIQNQTMRRMKLRQMLLLVLRCLAIFLLISAFARPTLKVKRGLGHKQARSSIVLLVDRSMSMGRKGLFPKARESASAVIDLMHPEDEAALVWSVDENSPSFTHSGDDLKSALNRSDVAWGRNRVFHSIDKGSALLSNAFNINQEMVLISDLQASGFRDSEDSTGTHNWAGRLYVIPINGEMENIAIVDGGIENQILQPDLPLRIFAHIKNCGKKDVEDLLIRIFSRDEVAGQKVVDIGADETQRVSFRIMPETGGWIWGTIRIEDDGLFLDNELFFCCWIPEEISVLTLGHSTEDVRTLQMALTPQTDQSHIYHVNEAFFTESWVDRLGDVDVLMFSNYPSFGPTEADRLKRFVEDGGGVIFFMGDDVDLRNMNESFFVPVLGITLGNVLGGQGEGGGYLSFGTVDYGHPLFRGVFERGEENIHSPRFFRVVELMNHRAHKILSLGDGRPFLLEMPAGKGKVFISTSGIKQTWSDLAFTTFYAPLVTRSVAYLSTPALGEKEGYRVGESISLTVDVEDMSRGYRLEDPSGEKTLLHPEMQNGKVRLNLKQTLQTGIYRFYQGETLLGMEAVNVDPLESELEPLMKDEVKDKFPEAKLEFVDNIEDIEAVVSEARWGRELWRELLLVCLIVLVVEMLIARESKKA